MTTYLDPVNGSRISQTYAEAMTGAAITIVMLETYELRHPNFIENGAVTPIRVVNEFTDVVAQLESTAVVNPNTYVTFTALPVTSSGPDENDTSGTPAVTLQIDGASGHIAEQLDLALLSAVPVAVTQRIYASNDLSAPARMPVINMILRSVIVGDVTVSASATFYDPSNNSFPRKEYVEAEHPGLAAS